MRHKGSRETDGAVYMPEFQDAMNAELLKRGFLQSTDPPFPSAELVRGLRKGSDKSRFSVCIANNVYIAVRADSGHTGDQVNTGAGVTVTSADAPLAWHLTWGKNKDSILKKRTGPSAQGKTGGLLHNRATFRQKGTVFRSGGYPHARQQSLHYQSNALQI